MPHPFADIGTCILQELGAKDAITVERFSGGAHDATGRYSGQVGVSTPTTAVVQPSGPKEIEKLPENSRTKEAITVFTRNPLLTSDVSTQGKADVITWNGRTYEVAIVEDWSAQAQFAKAVATRKGA